MKKFLSKITFVAVAIISATGFASCNNSDDDPYVPTPAPAEQSKLEEVSAYEAVVSENVLNMYDITLVFHSGDKSKETVLTKANGKACIDDSMGEKVTYYEFFCSEFDGKKGIDRVEAKVTPKADIENTIKSMPAEASIIEIVKGQIYKAVYDANGKQIGGLGKENGKDYSIYSAGDMLDKAVDGTSLNYQVHAQIIAENLTRK